MRVSLRSVSRLALASVGSLVLGLPAAAQVSTESGFAPVPAQVYERGESFGNTDQSVTWLPMALFQPRNSAGHAMGYSGVGYQNRTGGSDLLWAALDLPNGAIIDSITLFANDNSAAGTARVLLTRFEVPSNFEDMGNAATSGTPGLTQAEFQPARVIDNSLNEYVVYIDLPIDPALTTRGVRVLWRRQVSPAPGTATFGDVPLSHTYFRAIEALAASKITSGCGSGNFCPDQNVTRGEVAAFFARAMGLHYPFSP